MRYPVRIVIENGCAEILLLKLVIGIDDRFHMIPILYDMQPREHIALKILYTLVIRLMLDVEHGRKIAIRKMHLLQKVIRLFASRRFIAPEMIHATDESIVASLIEVLAEILIQATGTLGTLDDDKAHRTRASGSSGSIRMQESFRASRAMWISISTTAATTICASFVSAAMTRIRNCGIMMKKNKA
jgi:hypothetical protein